MQAKIDKDFYVKDVEREGLIELSKMDKNAARIYSKIYFIYENPSNFTHSYLNDLVLKLLPYMPFLAAKVTLHDDGDISADSNGRGVRMIQLSTEHSYQHLKSAHYTPKVICSLFCNDMDNHSDMDVFIVQTLRFQTGELILGFYTLHSILDGSTIMQYLTLLSKLAHNEPIVDKPVHMGNGLDQLKLPIKKRKQTKSQEQINDIVFNISQRKLEQLKKDFMAGNNDKDKWVSTNDCIMALVWRLMLRIKNKSKGHTSLVMAFNLRSIKMLGMDENSMGNGIVTLNLVKKVEEILDANLFNVSYGIREFILYVSDNIKEMGKRMQLDMKQIEKAITVDRPEIVDVIYSSLVQFEAAKYLDLGFTKSVYCSRFVNRLNYVTVIPVCLPDTGINVQVSLRENELKNIQNDKELGSYVTWFSDY